MNATSLTTTASRNSITARDLVLIIGTFAVVFLLVFLAANKVTPASDTAPKSTAVHTSAEESVKPTEHTITVCVIADQVTEINYPKNPLQYELYRNGECIRTEVKSGGSIHFEKIQVKVGDKLKAKVHWRNGYGAIVETDETVTDTTIDGANDVYIRCR